MGTKTRGIIAGFLKGAASVAVPAAQANHRARIDAKRDEMLAGFREQSQASQQTFAAEQNRLTREQSASQFETQQGRLAEQDVRTAEFRKATLESKDTRPNNEKLVDAMVDDGVYPDKESAWKALLSSGGDQPADVRTAQWLMQNIFDEKGEKISAEKAWELFKSPNKTDFVEKLILSMAKDGFTTPEEAKERIKQWADLVVESPAKKTRQTGGGQTSGAGAVSANTDRLHEPKTKAEYDAIPSGALFIDPDDGRTYRKP